ncbi:MAG: insulinase family protein [Lachnospiraceae bacterium]|nr:insulinase family protein [Lachnospiraceae bacterium]
MIKNEKYELIFEKQVDDLSSKGYLLRHKKSGARIFILSNDDDNKVFFVGFRTPPADSTGVAHIMEHSTLCGSEKFPLKDPFVELAKGSLNTFLNAMTFSDKTIYPVASCNDKDFRNLQDVYFDAVFHPNVYKHPEIMKQEGWSYRIENKDDPIEYNGVVYNEMKGAFSSPDEVLMRQTMNSLFPDTAYGVESGGDPDFIPDLTYDAFLDFHRKYYHPSNSYIYLYGNVDIEEQLEWMDREYLGAYDTICPDSMVAIQQPFSEMREIVDFYPITDDEDEKDNTYLSYSIVCGTSMDIKRSYAMQMITYALVDTQGAPIRQRLLDEGIGKDILPVYDDGILQPYLSITAKNANEEQKDRFLEIIKEEFEKAADGALNKRSLLASLNSLKFKYREADFGGLPKGLIYGISSLTCWLYDDDSPLLPLELGNVFDELEKEIDGSYFEDLIREMLLGNPHSSLVILKPKKGLEAEKSEAVAAKLAAFKESLSDEQIEELIAQTKALAAYQEEPSTKEALETIPLLERSDIKREPRQVSNIEATVGGIPVLWHKYSTNGIAYVSLMFDCNNIDKELFPYLGLLKSVISFVDTEGHTYSELNDDINITTGGFGMDCGVYGRIKEKDSASVLADMTVRVLYENIGKAFDLIEEVLFTGRYGDKKRLHEIVAELQSKLKMVLMSAGHMVAVVRASSYFSRTNALKELINGIEFVRFVDDIEKNFDERADKLIENLEKIIRQIIVPGGVLVNVTADEKGYDLVKARLAEFAEKLKAMSRNESPSAGVDFRDRNYDFEGKGFELKALNEAFKTSGAVNYVARAGRFIDSFKDYTGAVSVFHTIMRFEYLWFNIRVQGGAYGCMSRGRADGEMAFVTYRDPHVKRSNDIFEGIPDFLESFECDEREMTKYVIGTMSGVDTPLPPSSRGSTDFAIYMDRSTDEERAKVRAQIIDCTVDDIKKITPQIRKALAGGYICCVGSEKKIEEDKDLFGAVRNLFE